MSHTKVQCNIIKFKPQMKRCFCIEAVHHLLFPPSSPFQFTSFALLMSLLQTDSACIYTVGFVLKKHFHWSVILEMTMKSHFSSAFRRWQSFGPLLNGDASMRNSFGKFTLPLPHKCLSLSFYWSLHARNCLSSCLAFPWKENDFNYTKKC